MRWLLFRLMFLSGMVKLLSNDPSWRDLTALHYHYWTQPLPTWTAYWFDRLPDWFQRLSTFSMFTIELAAPFAMFGPRRIRLLGAGALIGLQLLIVSTGNYNFFNVLTVALCLTMVDDATLALFVPLRLRGGGKLAAAGPPRAGAVRRFAFAITFLFFFVAGSFEMLERLGVERVPEWGNDVLTAIAPFRTVNSYGLFAVMTKERHEISLEGSEDGTEWREYLFPWKPGPLDRKPGFVEPHQPRLDWQMWFAALGDCRRNGWFLRFQQRLLEGVPSVRALLANDPFAGRAPRYLRSTVWDYHFADPDKHRSLGQWWERGGPLGAYCPALTLENGRLVEAHLEPGMAP
jgi:hypothetical protein